MRRSSTKRSTTRSMIRRNMTRSMTRKSTTRRSTTTRSANRRSTMKRIFTRRSITRRSVPRGEFPAPLPFASACSSCVCFWKKENWLLKKTTQPFNLAARIGSQCLTARFGGPCHMATLLTAPCSPDAPLPTPPSPLCPSSWEV